MVKRKNEKEEEEVQGATNGTQMKHLQKLHFLVAVFVVVYHFDVDFELLFF